MLSFKELLVIFAGFYGFFSGTKDTKFSINPYYNLYMFTNVLIEIMVNIFVALYLPLGYVGYHILSHPLTTKMINKMIKKND
jgi:hypothetical protein